MFIIHEPILDLSACCLVPSSRLLQRDARPPLVPAHSLSLGGAARRLSQFNLSQFNLTTYCGSWAPACAY